MKTFSVSCALLIGIQSVQSVPLYMDHQIQEDYVPILGYHEIGDVTSSLIIKLEDYRDQVDYLTNTMNCNWITMKDLVGYVSSGEKLPTKTCIMNFDDGTADHYSKAFCSLNEHSVPATFYVATGDLDSSDFYMTTAEVADLASKGHDIAPHTITHANLPQLSISEQITEIIGSKDALNAMGYNVNTFAYPFGAFNDDTFDILRNDNDLVLTRDTSQDFSWKDVRASVVSFNPDNDLHFYYIKPEGLSGSELANIIRYIGWWQFEDNFKIISGSTDQIKVRSGGSFHPTDTSYGVLLLPVSGNEISTQFITKFTGSFTLDILASGVTGTFGVEVDGLMYMATEFEIGDPGRLDFTSSGGNVYVNFYVNILSLSPGVHVLNVVNTDGSSIILDKFRLWSNVDQDFSESSTYNSCDPSTDFYCDCSFVAPTPAPIPPIPDPMCELGIVGSSGLGSNICCSASCGTCGGTGCGDLPGGSSSCCGTPILNSGVSCDFESPPCIISEPDPIPDPTCDLGIIGFSGDDTLCCPSSCTQCTGVGCSTFPNIASDCCSLSILDSGVSCDDDGAPCIVTTSDPKCELGIIKDNICCDPNCDQCGGVSCGITGMGASCCGGPIVNSGVSCDTDFAPCVISPVDPTCELGIIKDNICCDPSCEQCGGVSCGITGMGSLCCGGPIVESGISCDDSIAPCVIGL